MQKELVFSREAAYLERSVMRELIQLIADPSIISLAGGLPADEFLPVDELRACMDAVLTRDGGATLQYKPSYMPLREWIADYMRGRGVACTSEQVFITNGNQQGLTILSRLFVDPGAPVVTEAITFTGIQQVTAGRGAQVMPVPTDLETGVEIDALEAAFARSPRLAILISDFHNPLGVSMTMEKRQRVSELAEKYGVPVVEDDPYSALRFEGDPLPPIKAYDDAGMVFYLGSFSKMLAPALRLGWLVAPSELLARLTPLREAIDLETSTLIQRTAAEFLMRGLLNPHLQRLNAANRERRDALLDALNGHFGDIAKWTIPQGGLFVWMTLPEGTDTWAIFEQAIAQKVAYIPGKAFGGAPNTLRLNFSKVAPADIHEGVARLARVLR